MPSHSYAVGGRVERQNLFELYFFSLVCQSARALHIAIKMTNSTSVKPARNF